jgi:hypothetical protein
VRVVDGPSHRTQAADARGQFVIDRVARGSYLVEVTSPSSPPKRIALDSDRWQDIRLELGGRIHAMIGDARSGAALAGIRVDATGPDKTTLARTSDVRGVVDLAGLAGGTWTLAIRARGYAPSVRELAIQPSRVALDVHLDLAKGATLAGIVRDRRGARVAGARVALGAVTTQTDADGNFVLVDAPIGPALIEASLGDARGSLSLQLAPGDERMTLGLEIGP